MTFGQRKSGAVLSYLNIFLKNAMYIIYTPFLLRFLGNAEYGMYQLTIQVVSTFSILSLGFSGAYIRFYWKLKSSSEEQVESLNGLYLLVFLIMSLIAIILGIVLVCNVGTLFGNSFTNSEIQTTRLLFIIMVFNMAVTFPSSVFDAYIMANQQFLFQQSRAILGTLMQPLLTIPMLFLGYKAVAVLIIQTIVTCFFLLLNIHFSIFKLNMKFQFTKFPKGLLKSLIVFSGFLLINDVVDIVNNNVPGIIVGSIVGANAVAIYSIAIQIRTIFFQLSLSLSSVFSPQINQIVSQDNDNTKLLDIMIKVGRFQLLILTIIFGGFILLGQYFIRIWAGAAFYQAYWMVIAMIIPVLVPLSQNVGIEIQRAKNLHQFRSIILAVFAIINVILTYALVSKFGVTGSIWGYVISVGIGNGLVINLYNHHKVGLNMIIYWKRVIPVVIPSIISTILILIFISIKPISNFYMFVLYGTLYVVFAMVLTLGILNKSERNIFLKFNKINRVK